MYMCFLIYHLPPMPSLPKNQRILVNLSVKEILRSWERINEEAFV